VCAKTATTAHTLLTCTTAAGVGRSHPVTITVGGQSVTTGNIVLSYAAPNITALTGVGAALADTQGGQVVNITGTNLGPVALGDGSAGFFASPPLQVTYGPPGSTTRYLATSCTVIWSSAGGNAGGLSCLTAPGTGKGYSWAVAVAGQSAPVFAANTSYAPPVVTDFQPMTAGVADINSFSTASTERVQISGSNFGPAYVDGSTFVSYQLTLAAPVTAYNTTIPTDSQNHVAPFVPTGCIMTVQHTQLLCNMARGAGAGLVWTVVVDGQSSSSPVIAYGLPVIATVRDSNGLPIASASTSGNDLVTLTGSNFGPANLNCRTSVFNTTTCTGLVQSVTYGRTGTEYKATYVNVLSHSSLVVRLLPGFGQNLTFVVTVAGQQSSPSAESFSFAAPTIAAITPSHAATNPTTTSPTIVTVSGFNFAFADQQADVGVYVGNPGDGTVSSLLPVTARVTAPAFQGGRQSFNFSLPEGMLSGRAVQVAVYFKGAAAGYKVLSNPVTDAAGYFDYDAPVVDYAVVSKGNATQGPCTPGTTPLPPDGNMTATYYKVTLVGRNFGPASLGAGDHVNRSVEFVDYADSRACLQSWSHTAVTVMTYTTPANVRVVLAGRTFDGTALTVVSNPVYYADETPSLGALVGSAGPFPTAGGSIIGFTAAHLDSMQQSLNVTVGGRLCPLVSDAAGTVTIDPTMVRANLTAGTWPRTQVGADSFYTLYCRLPAGQGTGNPLQVVRDGVGFSDTALTVDYRAPTVTSFTIVNATGSYTTAVALMSDVTLWVPTAGTTLLVNGTNFGLCPTLVTSWGTESAGSECASATEGAAGSHTFLQVTTLAGEGTGVSSSTPTGYTWFLQAGNQQTATARWRYLPPTISSVTAGGSTAGGQTVTIVGANFGISRPTVQLLNTTGPSAPGVLNCTNVFRWNATVVTCRLPEGSGTQYGVRMTVADQSSMLAGAFSYNPPVVTGVVYNASTPLNMTATIDGPAPYGFATTGGYSVTLNGNNFGVQNAGVHCLFVSWAGRQNRQLVCDGALTQPGEGEVPALAITAWNHTSVTFIMPPGAGLREVGFMIRGQPLAAPLLFRYGAPVITSLTPNTSDTDGGVTVQITGVNFGKHAVDNSTVPSTVMATSLDQYLHAVSPAYDMLWVNFFATCITAYTTTADGLAPGGNPALPTCKSTLLSHDHTSLTVVAAAGVGRDRPVSVTVFDARADQQWINATSNVALFSYNPPVVTLVDPWPVLQDGSSSRRLVLEGRNFGSDAGFGDLPDTAPERSVKVVVNATECTLAERSGVLSAAVTLQCDLPAMRVGVHQLWYEVAGQNATNPARPISTSAVFTACQGSTGADDMGYYGAMGEECWPCPTGAVCAGFVAFRNGQTSTVADEVAMGGRHTYPRPLPGFFNVNATFGGTAACPESFRNERDVCVVACEPAEACLGDNFCAEGYASKAPNYRCSSCADGFYKQATVCQKCPSSPAGVIIVAALVLVGVAAAAYFLNKKQINVGYISIGVDYFQVLAIFAQAKVDWPAPIRDLFHILSAFNFNIEIVAPECLVSGVSFTQKWVTVMVFPLIVAGLFAVAHVTFTAYKVFVLGRRQKVANHTGAVVSGVTVLFYIMYIYLTRTVLDIFNCVPTDPPDGYTYLTAVFDRCGVAGGVQMTLLGPAVVGLLVYVIGYPLSVASLLWAKRELIMEDQLLRAKGVGYDRLSNPRAYDMRKRFRNLYYQFKPDYIFWLMAILLRKFLLAVTYIMFNKNSSFQLAAALLVCFLAYAAQVRFTPYMSPGEYDVALREHEAAALTSPLHAKLRDSIARIDGRGRKKVHRNVLTSNGKVDYTAALGVLTSWMFNYNTVEAVLLFSAVVVSLMGIMFAAQSQYRTYYKQSRDAITGVALTVMIVSIIYFVTVLVTEAVILYYEDVRRKQLEKRAASKKSSSDKDPSVRSGRAHVSQGDQELMMGPVDSSMNPMFLSNGADGGSTAGIAETILAQDAVPGVDLWRLFQSSYVTMQEEITQLSRAVADGKLAQQKLEAAAAILAESGITTNVRLTAEVGQSPAQQRAMAMRASGTSSRKTKQEFTPVAALDEAKAGGRGAGVGGKSGMRLPVGGASLKSLKR
jgi:hypothetical protein